VSSRGESYGYSSSFSQGVLPLRAPPPEPNPVLFSDHIREIVRPSRPQGQCGSCWAYALDAAVQYALALAYRDLGFSFDDDFMSHQYLLSCYDVEGAMCGCWGGDLPRALLEMARGGIVTYRQFPYDNGPDASTSDRSVVCDGPQARGTCRACAPGEPQQRRELSWRPRPEEPLRYLQATACVPCDEAGWPRYYPREPFQVGGAGFSLEAKVEALKTQLRRRGPLAAVIAMDTEVFARLDRGGRSELPHFSRLPIYRLTKPAPPGAAHAVSVQGYWDPPGDRSHAVWICRNSWGPKWGYGLRSRTLRTTLGGFFSVSMYEGAELIGLVDRAVSFEGVDVQTNPERPRRAPSADDPFLQPWPPRTPRAWLLLVAAALLALLALLTSGPSRRAA